MRRFLVTGGAGFVGAQVALALKERLVDVEVTALDNLYRRGSELNVPRLTRHGVRFRHGDVRVGGDLEAVGPVDFVIECAAEPSVLGGSVGDPSYVLQTNLQGALNCAELCRRANAGILFLSTSRVYPYDRLRLARYTEAPTRYVLASEQPLPGLSAAGVSEDFPLAGVRSFYGAAKLSAELVLREYSEAAGIPVIVNRCGLLAGPWQFGKIDQGVLTYWLAAHRRRQPLKYIGFGGTGKQVRDALHIADLLDLIFLQLADPARFAAGPFNVGGGAAVSVSLCELTAHCQALTGTRLEIGAEPATRYADLPIYVTDTARIAAVSGWRPRRTLADILGDIDAWLRAEPAALAAL